MYDGSSRYDAGAVPPREAVQQGLHRARDLHLSRFKEKNRRLNAGDTVYEERFADTDLPHRIVLNGIYELPFGRNRRWGANSNAIVNGLIGNWSISAWWNWQSGRANLGDYNGLGNVYYNGDINQLTTDFSRDPVRAGVRHERLLLQRRRGADQRPGRSGEAARGHAHPARQQPAHAADAPARTSAGPTYTNVDMSFVKGVDFGRFRAQIHFELYNALNDVFYNNPNLDPRSSDFGKVTSQNNLPRNFQIGMKVLF